MKLWDTIKQKVTDYFAFESSIQPQEVQRAGALSHRANKGTNIYTKNWRETGKKVSVQQYSIEVEINWTDKDGVEQTRSETLLFPNMLSKVGNDDLKDKLTELMLSEARERLIGK